MIIRAIPLYFNLSSKLRYREFCFLSCTIILLFCLKCRWNKVRHLIINSSSFSTSIFYLEHITSFTIRTIYIEEEVCIISHSIDRCCYSSNYFGYKFINVRRSTSMWTYSYLIFIISTTKTIYFWFKHCFSEFFFRNHLLTIISYSLVHISRSCSNKTSQTEFSLYITFNFILIKYIITRRKLLYSFPLFGFLIIMFNQERSVIFILSSSISKV